MGVSSEVKYKAVFFDRDGVLNKPVIIDGKPYPPASIAEVEIIEGVKDGIMALKKQGYKVFVVTNQPDVGRGKTSLEAVEAIHDFMQQELEIDEIYCCFHGSDHECDCRKPKPGMILKATDKWNIDIGKSFMVGDRWRDIEAGNNAGLKSLLIDYNYDEKKVTPYKSCETTGEAIQLILQLNQKL